MRIALTPINPTVGDVAGAARLIIEAAERARLAGADLLVTPELAICGYPPRDLLLQEGFIESVQEAAHRVAEQIVGLVALVGAPWPNEPGDPAAGLTNSVLVMRDGEIVDRYDKRLLPTYDVFDEDRYFIAGDRAVVIDIAGERVGVGVCEDLWRGEDAGVAPRYRQRADPVKELMRAGASVIVNPSASPFSLGKIRRQRDILAEHVRRCGVPVVSVNQMGGNDELIFDGRAVALAPDDKAASGVRVLGVNRLFSGDDLIVEVTGGPGSHSYKNTEATVDPLDEAEDMLLLWEALRLGVRDYCAKAGFERVVLGLSGGIDSSLTACLAVAALGAPSVLGVSMPSRFSSEGSRSDAQKMAEGMGVTMVKAPIEGPHVAMEKLLAPVFAELGATSEPGVTEENLQARLRGVILMALSNKLGALLLTTGNKSELAVGYCTLYGDMNGGLAVLADVTKAQVQRLSRWINANAKQCGFATPPIPEAVLTKPPSAELRRDQKDQDSLPPYDVLDEVVERYVTRRQSPTTITLQSGIEKAIVNRLVHMIDANEYKRRQAPIGLKVTDVAFGVGRRMPIARG